MVDVGTAPAWIRMAADAAMYLHVAGGTVGLVTGAAALTLRKGGRAHRRAGNVFFVAMLIMAGLGAGVAPFLPARASVLGGLVTCYLVATAWITVWRPAGAIGRAEVAAFGIALGLTVAAATLGMMAARSPTGTLDGQPWQAFVLFGFIAPFAAACDLRVILRGSIAGAQRIARHLWRMCMALWIAAVSFFLGQQGVLPASLQDSPLLFAPPLAVLVVMGYWLWRVRVRAEFGIDDAARQR
jgi:hypothetical protein